MPWARPAQAQGGAAVALAQSLFDEGRTLMNEGRVAEACPKFAESQRLDPGGGTLLNLALCHERLGRLATAWAEFNEALSLALRDGRDDRAQAARSHIEALAPRLMRLRVRVEAPAAGQQVRLDGVVLGPAAWGIATPVDPGPHALTATAPGKLAARVDLSLEQEGSTRDVALPPLQDAPPLAASSASPPPPPPSLPAPPAPPPAAAPPLRWPGHALLGVGAAGAVVGVVFGLRALERRSASDKACPGGACSPEGWDAYRASRTSALVSDIGSGLGALGLGLGAWWLLAGPGARPAVRVGVAGTSVRLEGAW